MNETGKGDLFNEILENVSETVETVYEKAKEKASELLDSPNLGGFWKSAKEQIMRKKALLDDYATPVYKETGKMFKDAFMAFKDKLNKDK